MHVVLIDWLFSDVMTLVKPTIGNGQDDDAHVADAEGRCC